MQELPVINRTQELYESASKITEKLPALKRQTVGRRLAQKRPVNRPIELSPHREPDTIVRVRILVRLVQIDLTVVVGVRVRNVRDVVNALVPGAS